jgi:UDP-2,3-diacylglucosamine hydrolase
VDVLVLNGDIFDFRWSTLDSTETTISAAMQWLSALLELYADMRVVYVLGNHDCLPEFEQRLRSLSQAEPRLEVHPYFAFVGDALFLHGDCANGCVSRAELDRYRERWRKGDRFGGLAVKAYRYADRVG